MQRSTIYIVPPLYCTRPTNCHAGNVDTHMILTERLNEHLETLVNGSDTKYCSSNGQNLKHGTSRLHKVIHDLMIHEMLRKKGKATQHNRKTKQHNTTRAIQLFFKEKNCLRWDSNLRLSTCYIGVALTNWATEATQLHGWARITCTYTTKAPQPKHHKPDKQVNSNYMYKIVL